MRSALRGTIVLLLLSPAPFFAQGEVQIVRDESGVRRIVNPGPRRKAMSPHRTSRYQREIDYYSNDRGLDPRLVRAIIQVESDFDPRARSHKGAMGLMQLTAETAREMGVKNVWDPGENIRGGTAYLRLMLKRFGGDLELALAGYNAGPTVVERYGAVPPYEETRRYVEKVLSLYRGRRMSLPAPRKVAELERPTRPVQIERDESGQLRLVTSR